MKRPSHALRAGSYFIPNAPFNFALFFKNYIYKTGLTFYILLLCIGAGAQQSYSTQAVLTGMEFTAATGSGATQVADINRDGHVDILYNTVAAGAITYLQNNGASSFSTPATNPFAAYTSSTPAGFVLNGNSSIADYDCDGDPDIWCRVLNASNDVYLRNDNGTFTTQSLPSGLEFTASTGSAAVQVTDINNDGYVDVLFNTASGGAVTYWQNNGSGSFSTPASNPFASYTASSPSGFILNGTSSISDFDGDGDPDVWCRVLNAGNDVYLRNDAGTFTTQSVLSGLEFTASTGSAACQIADFNGDGFIDVVYNTAAGAAITYLQNNGSGAFSTPASNPFSAYTSTTPTGFVLNTTSSIADFDSDGDFDLWCRVLNASNDVYLRGSAEAPSLTSSTPADNATNVALSSNIVLNFSEGVSVGTGNIYIKRTSDNSTAQTIAANSASVTGTGSSTITINPPSDLASNSSYYIAFDRNALTDVDEGLIFGSINTAQNKRVPYTSASFLNFNTTGLLPVSLINFSASLVNGEAVLQWQTASEQNSKNFIVQRSQDAKDWTAIATLAAAGQSAQLVSYQFKDKEVMNGRNYYRLVQVDFNGSEQRGPVKLLQTVNELKLTLYPNPSSDKVTIQLPQTESATIIIYSNTGNELLRTAAATGFAEISLKALPAGIYHLLAIQNGTKYSETLYRR